MDQTIGADIASAAPEAQVVARAIREVTARRAAPPGGRRTILARRWATHRLALINAVNGLMLAGTIVAPWAQARGDDAIAAALYGFYRLQCPQRPDHSFHLFGEQLGMEQREVAIYAGWLGAGLILAGLGAKGRSLPLVALAAASLPMALDVGTQTLGLREGAWPWRVATGVLFAVASIWWAVPYVTSGRGVDPGRPRPAAPGGGPDGAG